MPGVYLSIKTNSLTGRNISLFTVFDFSTPLINKLINKCASLIWTQTWTTLNVDLHFKKSTSLAFLFHYFKTTKERCQLKQPLIITPLYPSISVKLNNGSVSLMFSLSFRVSKINNQNPLQPNTFSGKKEDITENRDK